MDDHTRQNGTVPTLADKLALCFADDERNFPVLGGAYEDLINRLKDSGAGESAPMAGHEMPEFVLPDSEGQIVRLSDLLKNGPLVISLNRGHWCPFCKAELGVLQEIYPAIQAQGAELVSIIPEIASVTAKIRSDYGLEFPVLTDLDNGLALQLNLMITLGQLINETYLDIGIDLSKSQGNDSWLLPLPATFVVDRTGRIEAAHTSFDFSNRMEPADILAALGRISQPD